MNHTVIALYREANTARQAADELLAAGFPREGIGLVSHETLVESTDGGERERLVAALEQFAVPPEHANAYAEGVRRGGSLVAADVDEIRVDEACAIMDRHRPVDIDAAAERWRNEGWSAYDETAPPFEEEERRRESDLLERETIDVVEEDVKVGKRPVRRGGVRIHAKVTELPVEEDVELREEHVHVHRTPVDEPLRPSEAERAFEEETIELEEQGEEIVVSKEARVVERVEIGKDVEARTEHVRDVERRQNVEVEHLQPTEADEDFARWESDFRTHHTSNFGTTEADYDEYRDAYAFGHRSARDTRFGSRDWHLVEGELRESWEGEGTRRGTWDRFKDAVRHAFDRARRRAA